MAEQTRRIELAISGMHCASCALLVNRSLKKVPGVTEANTNLATEKAVVIYKGNIPVNDLAAAVKKAGYEAAEITEENKQDVEAKRVKEVGRAKTKFLAGAILSAPLLISMFFKVEEPAMWMQIVAMLLASGVQFILGRDFYKGAWSALRVKTFNMDSLIAIGTSAAYGYSLVGLITGGTGMYFETSAVLITFVLLGKWLEARMKGKTSEAVQKLIKLQPKFARKIENGADIEVLIENLVAEDVVLVRPGERIPADGKITKGSGLVDEAMITGESIPDEKTVGDVVLSGTMVQNGSFEFEVTKAGKLTMLSEIIRLVETAASSKAPIQDWADRVSAWFVPGVLIIAGVTFFWWYAVLGATFADAMMTAVAVLVVACPCALGLATPTALIVGTGRGAEKGILIKGGENLEKAEKITSVVFDKTGTLTEGKPEVVKVNGTKDVPVSEVIRIAVSLERLTSHPLAEAVMEKAKSDKIAAAEVKNFAYVPGNGISGKIDGINYSIGNKAMMDNEKIKISPQQIKEMDRAFSAGRTVLLLAKAGKPAGSIEIADRLKKNARTAVAELKKTGIKVHMISGDNKQTAEAIGREAGVDNVLAEVLPAQKANEVEKLQKNGEIVAMTGDGINDAPALAVADLGISMSSGTDIAIEAGGVVLLRNDPTDVVRTIRLSKQIMNKIRQNLFFALIYNTLGIPIAAGVFSGWGLVLKPELAGLFMAMSSVSVVTNSLFLKRSKLD